MFVCEGGGKKRFLLYTVKIKTRTLWFCISRAVFSEYILPPGLCAMQLKMKCSFKLVLYLVWIRTPMSLSFFFVSVCFIKDFRSTTVLWDMPAAL